MTSEPALASKPPSKAGRHHKHGGDGDHARTLECLLVPDSLEKDLHKTLHIVLKQGWANVQWSRGFTALHLAAKQGCEDAVRLLLHASAAPSLGQEDCRQKRPFDYAKDKGHGESLLELLNPKFAKSLASPLSDVAAKLNAQLASERDESQRRYEELDQKCTKLSRTLDDVIKERDAEKQKSDDSQAQLRALEAELQYLKARNQQLEVSAAVTCDSDSKERSSPSSSVNGTILPDKQYSEKTNGYRSSIANATRTERKSEIVDLTNTLRSPTKNETIDLTNTLSSPSRSRTFSSGSRGTILPPSRGTILPPTDDDTQNPSDAAFWDDMLRRQSDIPALSSLISDRREHHNHHRKRSQSGERHFDCDEDEQVLSCRMTLTGEKISPPKEAVEFDLTQTLGD